MSAPDGSPVGAERSIGQLVASATTEMSALVHDEIALAKAQLRQDVKRGATSGGAFGAAGMVLLFSLPMLNFALAYGIRTWSGWNLAVCFLLSFAANVLVAGLLALIGTRFAKKVKKSQGPQTVAASMKETAGVLQNAKPHPRPELPHDRAPEAIEAVARSSS
ncbi:MULTISPECIES: phage holin family protein [unclassified Streptomyces]|uniref:phage holin family protein n=1 Tax=unclassified Streptomyces TaxID=2593676 RepID=UPI00119D2C6C|nr:phage holin family protein [Streptomyces sp. BK340]TVZ75780.1 putative superfamily III holin-X [Streptomyces sp. BK340]